MSERIDIDAPLWDQRTFFGRFRHFAFVTDPRTCFVSNRTLDEAKILVDQYRRGAEPPGTTLKQVIYAKKLYESAFHPDTGERQNLFGRMSFQLPGNMLLTGALLHWYKTNTQVVFWQWVNQSFNALVNYTNRNAKSTLTTPQIIMAYVTATTCALGSALGSKYYWSIHGSPFIQRYVPFVAVAVANAVNVPLMRQNEILYGIECIDDSGQFAGRSSLAAIKAIAQVVISRISMCAPGMLLLPIVMDKIEPMPFMKKNPNMHIVFQVLACGVFLIFMVPAGCGLFPQKCSIKTATVKSWEKHKYEDIAKRYGSKNVPNRIYFNKGL